MPAPWTGPVSSRLNSVAASLLLPPGFNSLIQFYADAEGIADVLLLVTGSRVGLPVPVDLGIQIDISPGILPHARGSVRDFVGAARQVHEKAVVMEELRIASPDPRECQSDSVALWLASR